MFRTLNGRNVGLLGRRWKIEVYSVIELAGRRYVQIALAGPRVYLLTLRLELRTVSGQVVPALLPWLARPTESGDILDIPANESSTTKTSPVTTNVIPWKD